MHSCFYFDTGYVVLQNCETITGGIVAFPYTVLLEAFVPYLSDFQPKVHNIIHPYSNKLFIYIINTVVMHIAIHSY